MKILLAIKSMNTAGGGAERVLAEISDGLAERGHLISILTYDSLCGNSFYPLHRSIDRINLNLGDVKCNSTFSGTLRRMTAIRRAVCLVNPDIVVGFMHSMFIPLGLALLGSRYPVIASEHIGIEHYRTRPVERLLLQLTPSITKATTVISENLRQGFNARLGNYMTVIPNPVSMPEVARADEIKSDFARKRILSVGRLAPQKDHRTLIDAFARLGEDFPEWDLRIVGDGELRPRLEGHIKTLGFQGRIHIAGIKSNIAEEYLNAQLFVVPSLYESFGLATAEALTYGLPAIGFADCPGTNELIRHNQNGLLVHGAQREEALAEGLRCLMASKEVRERLGSAGPQSMAVYSKEKICDQWEELLQKWCRS